MRYRRSSTQYVSGTASVSVFALHTRPAGPPPASAISTPLRSSYAIHPKPASPFGDDVHEHERTRRKNVMDTEERRRRLEADLWALVVLPKLVKCRGCLRWIKLDQRSMYYGGLWNKHRDLCRGIKMMKGEYIPKRTRRSKGAAKIAKSGKGITALQSTKVRRKDAKGRDASVSRAQGTPFSRDPSLSAKELKDVTFRFELPHALVQNDSPRNSCQHLSSESDDDADLMTPQSMPSTLLEEVHMHSSCGVATFSERPRDVDDEDLQYRYQGRADYNDSHKEREDLFPDPCVAVAKGRPNRYQSITDVSLDVGAYTNQDETERYATPTTSPRNVADHLSANTLTKEGASRQQTSLVGPEVPADCYPHSVVTADNILPPLLAHPTAHDRSLHSMGHSQSEESEDDVEGGAFAPEFPDSCPASPCYHRFRFSTQRELDTYFDNSTVESMAYNMTFAFGPNDLNGAHCLLSLAMSSGR